MSAGHVIDAESPRQESELYRIELQMSLGIITRRSLCRLLRVDTKTVSHWIALGWLTPFRPGTDEKYFRVDDVRAFMAKCETFAGKRRPRRRKATEIPQ